MIPERVTRVIIVSSLVPKKFMVAGEVGSPWVAALMRTAQVSPRMHRMIVGAAIRSWKAIGSRRMFSMQFASYKPDVVLAIQPESNAEHDHAVNMAIGQNLDYAVIAFEHAMRDWSDRIDACAVPIDLISGEYDPIAPVGGIRNMAAAYPDKMSLHLIKDAGYMIFLGSTDAVIKIMKGSASR